jgi:NADPH2:quinone reductase
MGVARYALSLRHESSATKGTKPVKAIRIHRHGGPEVLIYEEVDICQPGPGVNFVDIYLRAGADASSRLPFTLGKEGAGEVLAVGEGVTGFAPGDRVGYVETLGAYAEECIVPVHFLVHLPDAIDFETAAAMMLKGLTAEYLLRRTFRVEAGHTILAHAATGGVGLVLTQWATYFGATVIGTVGSPEKAELARQNG